MSPGFFFFNFFTYILFVRIVDRCEVKEKSMEFHGRRPCHLIPEGLRYLWGPKTQRRGDL